jgi:putative nucleotidyltransferase with HDIG domain
MASTMAGETRTSRPVARPGSRDRRRILYVGAAFALTTAVHALVGRGTHPLHVVHVVFGALYLVPIVAAAVWLGARPAVGMALASAAAYLVHARTAWVSDAMENANQLTMAAVYVFVGVVSAALVHAADRERLAREESERAAQREAIVQGVATLSRALRQRDDGTGAHCERVAPIAVRIGAALGLEASRLDTIRLAALVHDVGKIGVRDDVLLKPEKLTDDERARIERHPAIAAEILRPIRGAEDIAEIVLCHHECPDGSGYPRQLAGDRIPVEARVLRVADVFAAFVEARPYKGALAPDEAISRMRRLDRKLDAVALAALERLVAAGALASASGVAAGAAPASQLDAKGRCDAVGIKVEQREGERRGMHGEPPRKLDAKERCGAVAANIERPVPARRGMHGEPARR